MFGCSSGKTDDAPETAPRSRNAAATRQAILDAAKTCFTQDGYEQVGVRDIAARAGVDPALVNRYFGSKEGLFAEAIARKFDLSPLLDGDRATLGRRLAEYVLQKKPVGANYDPLMALLRSSSSEVCGGMLRGAIQNGFVRPLAERLEGPDALARAELVGSTLLGLLVHRSVIGGAEEADNERIVALMAPMLQGFIDGTG
ncbi:MAG: TetR family transcriptional regulator [Chloroflexi bacterium]|nr:TetR family transcriptional regulator [Chloroflexota bacterium]